MKDTPSVRLRSILVLLLVLGAARLLVTVTAPLRRSPVDFDELLAAAAAWLLLAATAWAVLVCGALVVEALSAGRLRATTWVGCPRSLHRVLLAGAGIALVAVPTSPASGTELRPPSRPTGGVVQVRESVLRVVVRPGDALWRIAERRLPRDARPVEIATLVDGLHRRNRDLIGPDPDLIRPGQRLTVPTRSHTHASSRHREENP